MQSVASSKLVKKIRDERFDEDNIHAYTLLLNLGPRDLQVAVLNGNDNRVLYLEDNVFPSVESGQGLIDAVEELLDHHPFLRAGFWNKVKLAVKNQKLVQVPSDVYSETSAGNFLKFNATFDPVDEAVHHTSMPRSQATTVFAIPHRLKGVFEEAYQQSEISFIHQSAALIESVMEYAKTRNDNPLYLYVDRFKLHIIAVKSNQLVYYNQFSILSFEDYIKYIMLVLKMLDMNQQTSELIMWGYIGKNSPHYHEFYKYIQNVSFGGRPSYLSFGYPFDEVQDHHYFDLYSISLCD